MKMSALVAAVTAASLASSAWALDYDELRARANRVMGSVQSTPEEDIENPVAKLGQALFSDMRLSSSGEVACANCHFQENWGSDSRERSINAPRGGRTMQSQTVFHSMETPGLRWLADRESGAAQAIGSITGSMGFDQRSNILPVLKEHGYEGLFQELSRMTPSLSR